MSNMVLKSACQAESMMAGGPGRVGLLGRVVGPVQVEVSQDDDDHGGDDDGRVVGPIQFEVGVPRACCLHVQCTLCTHTSSGH